MKNNAESWLVISVLVNAILGGILASIIFDSDWAGRVVGFGVLVFSTIMVSIANHHQNHR